VKSFLGFRRSPSRSPAKLSPAPGPLLHRRKDREDGPRSPSPRIGPSIVNEPAPGPAKPPRELPPRRRRDLSNPSSFPNRPPGLSREPCQVINIQIVCLMRVAAVNLRKERDARARLGRLKRRSEDFPQGERGIPPVVSRGEDGERSIPHGARSIPQGERGATSHLHDMRRRECAIPSASGNPACGESQDAEGEWSIPRRSRSSLNPSSSIPHGERNAKRRERAAASGECSTEGETDGGKSARRTASGIFEN
jgi:hypothetical protein